MKFQLIFTIINNIASKRTICGRYFIVLTDTRDSKSRGTHPKTVQFGRIISTVLVSYNCFTAAQMEQKKYGI